LEEFSAVVIARNEEKTIPRLIKSLEGVDNIVIMDTGSTDCTVKVAEDLGATVFCVGDTFIETPIFADVKMFENRYGFTPSFTTESKLFNYAAARNHAMTLAEHDFCFQPDCDEIVEWDLPRIKELLPNCDQLAYRFCFAHNPDGSPALEFQHCKFFRKSKGHRVKKVHEVVAPLEVKYTSMEYMVRIKYTDAMYLHHWQEPSVNRTNYLPKLEYAILEKENDDRNTYYLAREYYYNQKWDTAIMMFEKYLELGGWIPEQGQALIFMGDCYKYSGRPDKAKELYHAAMIKDDTRREPFFALAMLHAERNELRSAVIYLKAALEIPYNPTYYLNNMNIYSWEIHEQLSVIYDKLGEHKLSQQHWFESVREAPNDARILSNGKWFCRKV